MARRRRKSSPFSLFAFQDIITAVTGVMILVTMLLTLELLQRKEQSPAAKTAQTIEQVVAVTAQLEAEIAEIERAMAAQSDLIKYDQAALRRRIAELAQQRAVLERDVDRLRVEQEDARQRQASIQLAAEQQEATPELLAALQNEITSVREHLERLRRSNRMIFNPVACDQKQPWLVELETGTIQVAKVGEIGPPRSFQSVDAFLKWSAGRNAHREYFVLLVKPDTIGQFDLARETLSEKGFDVGFDVLAADQTAIDPQTGAAP